MATVMTSALGIIAGLIGVAIVMGAACLLLAWVYVDAESRGKPGGLVVLLVLFLQLPGLLVWLVFRPEEKPNEDPSRQ